MDKKGSDLYRDLKNLNDIGKRIKWCRNVIGLSRKELSEESGISASTLCERESGVRSRTIEDYWIFSRIFSDKWEDLKYIPEFNGVQIKKITICWILMGFYE